VFMLKHIKDIRSPIAVAQQKHAARKATSIMTADTTVTHGHSKSPSTSRSANRPPRLEVQDLSASAPSASSLSPQPGWPEPGVVSPAVDNNPRADEIPVGPGSAGAHTPGIGGTTLTASTSSGHEALRSRAAEPTEQPPSASTSARDVPVASTGVSYAVAIYPYMAEQEDEFDVVV
jgi:bZIP factor